VQLDSIRVPEAAADGQHGFEFAAQAGDSGFGSGLVIGAKPAGLTESGDELATADLGAILWLSLFVPCSTWKQLCHARVHPCYVLVMSKASSSDPLDLATVKKWAKAQEKQFNQLKRLLDKSEDVAVVLKGLDVSEPGLRSFRNRARKLQREFPTPARSRQKVLREVEGEIKRFAKILALV
jgi:hypothetical protein